MDKKTKKSNPAKIEVCFGKERTAKDFIRYISSPWRIMLYNFIAGTFSGLGFVVGVALILTIVGYVFGHFLVDMPVVGEIFARMDDWLKVNLENY